MPINQSEHVIKQQEERIRELEEKYLKAQYENEGLLKQVEGTRGCPTCIFFIDECCEEPNNNICITSEYKHWQPQNKG